MLRTNMSQKSYKFTLQEAIDFAIDSSYATINARRDVAIALKTEVGNYCRGFTSNRW